MSRPKQLSKEYLTTVFFFASPVYWPDAGKRKDAFEELEAAMHSEPRLLNVVTIESLEEAKKAAEQSEDAPCIVVALSGCVQPWIQLVCQGKGHLAVFNAYLPEAIEGVFSAKLMHANAHPASTDFFAACRIAGKSVHWFTRVEEISAYTQAWQAVCRLKNARFLKIGETEPWVINSCREPSAIRNKVGCEVIPIEREKLYALYRKISDTEATEEAKRWISHSNDLINIDQSDILKASRVTLAMRQILDTEDADGLSMACFAMIGDLDTTSCLALSALNDSAYDIGACEGDLDAALTLYLLKALAADFVWIGNPIIHMDNNIDLAHCTAPLCAYGTTLQYKLMRHHESGRGVSPEVKLPEGLLASASRVSVNTSSIVCHAGMTQRQPKVPACHTQIRLKVESSQKILDTLLGTHLVLSYGDYTEKLRYVAEFLNFDYAMSVKRPD